MSELIFLSLGCNLVMWYNLIKSNATLCRFSQYLHMGTGNQHGSHKYDDLENLLDMTSHEKPLLALFAVVCVCYQSPLLFFLPGNANTGPYVQERQVGRRESRRS